jgi:hypothetical protein
MVVNWKTLSELRWMVIAAALMTVAGTGAAAAQDQAAACVTQLKTEYGTAAGLNAECPSDTDCTFLAPTGNASARVLLDTVATKAESCFKAAGLASAKENKQDIGTTRTYNGEGAGKCALLISTPNGLPPEGVRAVCQSE